MRDARLVELEFLSDISKVDCFPVSRTQTSGEALYGLNEQQFRDLVIHLLLNGYVNGTSAIAASGILPKKTEGYHLVSPGRVRTVEPSSRLAEDIEQLVELDIDGFLKGRYLPLRLNHKGSLRLFELRDQVESQRQLDPLTKLFLRGSFDSDFQIAFNFDRVPVTVIFCDVDHFKAVNDTYNHVVGDTALIAIAEMLSARAKVIGTAYRWGGDEFVALLPQVNAEQGRKLAEEFRAEVEQHFKASKDLTKLAHRPTVTVSVCTFDKKVSPQDAIQRLDEPVAAKNSTKGGKNRVYPDLPLPSAQS